MSHRQQAMALLTQAEQAVAKKSFWGKAKPDWDEAVGLFEKAAALFKLAKDMENSIKCLVKAAEGQRMLESFYMSAKHYESAGFMATQSLNLPKDAVKYYKSASDMFTLHSSMDRAAEMLEKAAVIQGAFNIKDGIEGFKEACELTHTHGTPRAWIDIEKKFLSYLAKWEQVDMLYDRLKSIMPQILQHQPFEYGKYSLLMCIILLMKGMLSEAIDFVHSGDSAFINSTNGQDAAELVQWFTSNDLQALQKVISRPSIGSLGNDFLKLAKRLRPQGAVQAQSVEELQAAVEEEGFL